MAMLIGAPTLDGALEELHRRVSFYEERGERTLVFCEDALTLLAERAVLRGRQATFLTDVTTFARWLSGGRVLSKQGSVAAVSVILTRLAGRLACFSANAAQAVYETIAQLSASRVDADKLREGARQSEGMLRAKLEDLALVYEEYAAFLKERGLLDENGYLALFPEKLASGAVRGVNVIFFGFTSFTRQAAEGILAAAQHAKSLTGIFPAGKEPYYTNESARVFRSVCPDAEVRLADSPLTGEAERVRRSMFSPEAAFLAPERSPRVHVMRPQDEWEEARFVCARIKKYVREEGLRYRDIAVLATETSALERELAAYGIPCFADVKRPFSRHPFCAYVLAVLRVAADGGLPESVDAAAANVCFGDGSAYRNYLARCGARRGGYRREIDPERAAEFADPALLAACRARMTESVACFPRSGTGRAFAAGVRRLRELVGADEVASSLAAHFAGAERDFLSLDPLEDLLAEAETVAGDGTFSAREFAALFAGAAEACKRAMIPVLSDAVFLGDACASRFSAAKVLFLTGATDALPAAGEDTALITDGEMERLSARGVDIEPAIAVVNARARESAALNACSFTQALYVTCPLRVYGEERTAGEVFASCAALFGTEDLPSLFPDSCSECIPALTELFLLRSDFEEGRTRDERTFSSLWAALCARGEEETLLALTEGREKQPLPAAGAACAGDVSPTLLETYFKCPYQGFMKHVLRLKEREEGVFAARDAGTFLHDVLCAAAGKFNAVSTEGECRALARALGQELLAAPRYAALGESAAGPYACERLLGDCETFTLAAWRTLTGSAFRVRGGEEAVALPALGLRGRADRVDEAEDAVRVVDYKTGHFDAGATAYYTGRSLQLELYLLAASKGKQPAGAFYFPASDGFLSAEKAKSRFCMTGFFDRDRAQLFGSAAGETHAVYDDGEKCGMPSAAFRSFLHYSELVTRQALGELRAGNHAPSPYAGSCTYCAFRGACGYDGPPREEPEIGWKQIAEIADRADGKEGEA